jgi:cation diffusion facilitator CzcD-associated flavoprotein CzcO
MNFSVRVAGAPSSRRVCVIGAGPCGLATVKNLLAAGIDDVVCYEEASAIGGNWVYDDAPDRRSVYRATRLISSKRLSEFEDFPMPDDYPDFPSHRQMLDYFEAYAKHFGLPARIVLETRVESASRLPDGKWSVATGPGGTRVETFDDLIICSGHHRDPLMPEYPGAFSGRTLHSREYKRPEPFENQRILVVGGGNSACDIAVDVSRVAASVAISMREGYFILPKMMFGRPTDQIYAKLRRYLPGAPRFLLDAIARAVVRFEVGPWDKYGLQAPKGSPIAMHPTLNTGILSALRDGSVRARPAISSLDGRLVRFNDGSAEHFDTIIWATGYRFGYPFLDDAIMGADFTHFPPLYLGMMHPGIENLYFIGLFQPIGCIWRLADLQARIAALQIKGVLRRPADVGARSEREANRRRRRYGTAARHLIEVDYHDFRRDLQRELGRYAVAPASSQLACASRGSDSRVSAAR